MATNYDAKTIRLILAPYCTPGILRPILIFALDATLYTAALIGAVALHSLPAKFVLAIAAGLFSGLLFLLGHDACHGSLTRSRRLNAILGRLAFIPTAHPFSLWALGHNRIHHRFTNLKGVDYVWAPFSRAEFAKLPQPRRFLEKLYRSVPGHLFYYLFEIWWKKMFFPNRTHVPERQPEFLYDCLLVLVANLGLLWCILAIGRAAQQPWYSAVFFGFCIPFAIWNWLMGFVIYQHHTHPSVAWFEKPSEWRFWESQIEGTTHIQFPRWLNVLLHNIMEHPAHHSLTSIPLYHLHSAQRRLEAELGSRMILVRWTFQDYLRTVSRCKLYDYQRHCWLDFTGRQTSAVTVNHG